MRLHSRSVNFLHLKEGGSIDLFRKSIQCCFMMEAISVRKSITKEESLHFHKAQMRYKAMKVDEFSSSSSQSSEIFVSTPVNPFIIFPLVLPHPDLTSSLVVFLSMRLCSVIRNCKSSCCNLCESFIHYCQL